MTLPFLDWVSSKNFDLSIQSTILDFFFIKIKTGLLFLTIYKYHIAQI